MGSEESTNKTSFSGRGSMADGRFSSEQSGCVALGGSCLHRELVIGYLPSASPEGVFAESWRLCW